MAAATPPRADPPPTTRLVALGLAAIEQLSVVFFDRDLRIAAVQGGAPERHGYAPDRLVGRLACDAVPASVWADIGPLYAGALDGRTTTHERSSHDGTAVYETTFQPVHDGDAIIGGMAVSRDVTENRRRLGEAQTQLQAVLDHSPMSIFLRDLEGRWVVVNRTLQRVLGHGAAELTGRDTALTHTDAQRSTFAEDDRAVLASGEAQQFDVVFPDAELGEDRHFWLQKFPVLEPGGRTIGLGGISVDVTDREREQRELDRTRSLLEQVFEHAPIGKVISRVLPRGQTEVVRCNPAFAAMLGMQVDDVLGATGVVMTHPDDLPVRRRMLDAVSVGRPGSCDLRLRHRDGRDVWVHMAITPIPSDDGSTLLLAQTLDISDRKRLEDRLQHVADHDPLTGLFNRRRFAAELGREVARVGRHGGHGCLLVLDLDGFKAVNDVFGHAAGDELLATLGLALRGTLREIDVVARLGGDEFAVILADTDLAGGRAVAAKLVAAVGEHGAVVRDGRRRAVTTSIGLTTILAGSLRGADELLVEADVAMYVAKGAGKGRVRVHERAELALPAV